MYTDSGSSPLVMQAFSAVFPSTDDWAWNAAMAAPVYDVSQGAWVMMPVEHGPCSIAAPSQAIVGTDLKNLPDTEADAIAAVAAADPEEPSPNMLTSDDRTSKHRRRGRRNRHRRGKIVPVKGNGSPRSTQDEEEATGAATETATESLHPPTADLGAFPPLPRNSTDASSSQLPHCFGAWGRRVESTPDSCHSNVAQKPPLEFHCAASEPGTAQAASSDPQSPEKDETVLDVASQLVQARQVLSCPLDTACSVKQLGESEKLCTEFIQILGQCGAEKEDAIVEWVAQDLLELALSQFGCRLVQKLLDMLGSASRERLVVKLAPSTVSLYESPNGNHVLTKVIQVMPSAALTTIIEQVECKGYWEVARHSFGCRVLERLIEHCKEDQMRGLIDRLVGSAEELCRHKFGNFVIQHLLEHGEEHRRAAVVERLLPRIAYLSMHRTACHVVQRALNYGGAEGQMAIVRALLNAQGSNNLAVVAASRYGSYVVEELAHLRCTWVVDEVRRHLTDAPLHLRSCVAFKRVATAYGHSLPCGSGKSNGDEP
eukprot:CAMPEP_0115237786 /NCGR_PEP_ID=MMETSP0270-20121206/36541_1 /TAXON_ID=71861 /ORGANISM="Scrippsiella trochoidea, Strain CCMP3099" /LENGTH=542 /DNA_ID=CAMNT_0002652681 /DNA_START=76 /DNA_END=1704 /DNA_ORIENTATION=-